MGTSVEMDSSLRPPRPPKLIGPARSERGRLGRRIVLPPCPSLRPGAAEVGRTYVLAVARLARGPGRVRQPVHARTRSRRRRWTRCPRGGSGPRAAGKDDADSRRRARTGARVQPPPASGGVQLGPDRPPRGPLGRVAQELVANAAAGSSACP